MSIDSAGPDPARTFPPQPALIAGIGARKAASAADVLALLDSVLAGAGFSRTQLTALATSSLKARQPALNAAAASLGVPLVVVPETALSAPVPTPSAVVAGHIGVASVAEAAAMAFGPLLVPKQASARVTCALASNLSGQAVSSASASSAASTLATSSAGP